MAAALSLSDQLPYPACPKCGASEYRKAGKNSHNKQQMLRCRKCGRSWTLDVSVDLSVVDKGLQSLRISGEDLIPDEVVCKRCKSPNIRLAGWFRTKSGNNRRARCIDCKKYFPAPELNDIETLEVRHKDQKKLEPDICPKCEGRQIGSGGRNSNGQALAHCKTCSTRWVLHPTAKEPLPPLTCPSCAQKEEFVKGGVENGSQRYRCQKCLTTFLPDGKWIQKCPDCGSGRYRNRGFSTSKNNLPYYKCIACSRHYSQRSRPKIENNPHVLDARSLGVDLGHYQSYKISFSHIRPSWLRDAILQYTKLKLGQGQWKFQTAKSNVSAVAVFGEYLEEHYSGILCHELTRKIFVEVMTSDWWITWCDSTKKRFLGTLSDLYEAIEKYHWGEVSGDRLVFQEDYPRSSKIKARNIPESVMDQIIAKC